MHFLKLFSKVFWSEVDLYDLHIKCFLFFLLQMPILLFFLLLLLFVLFFLLFLLTTAVASLLFLCCFYYSYSCDLGNETEGFQLRSAHGEAVYKSTVTVC